MKSKYNADIDLIEIKTSAYDEENFLLVTNLKKSQIKKVIAPIVKRERDSDGDDEFFYDNETLYWALKEAYPDAIIHMYVQDGIPQIEI